MTDRSSFCALRIAFTLPLKYCFSLPSTRLSEALLHLQLGALLPNHSLSLCRSVLARCFDSSPGVCQGVAQCLSAGLVCPVVRKWAQEEVVHQACSICIEFACFSWYMFNFNIQVRSRVTPMGQGQNSNTTAFRYALHHHSPTTGSSGTVFEDSTRMMSSSVVQTESAMNTRESQELVLPAVSTALFNPM